MNHKDYVKIIFNDNLEHNSQNGRNRIYEIMQKINKLSENCLVPCEHDEIYEKVFFDILSRSGWYGSIGKVEFFSTIILSSLERFKLPRVEIEEFVINFNNRREMPLQKA